MLYLIPKKNCTKETKNGLLELGNDFFYFFSYNFSRLSVGA